VKTKDGEDCVGDGNDGDGGQDSGELGGGSSENGGGDYNSIRIFRPLLALI
jgi:hypothetical protein